MEQWRIYYGDGSTFSDAEGAPSDAPALDVQVIAQAAGIAIGRRTVSRYDYYWCEAGEWYGGDLFGLYDFLMRSGLVKFGRAMPSAAFEAILTRAVTDGDMTPKHAWDPHERQ